VTVVIVHWNGHHFIHRCLSVLFAQTILPNEIILVEFTVRGKCRMILKSELDAFKSLQPAWRKQKKIQNKRVAGIRTIWEVLNKNSLPDRKGEGLPLITLLIGFSKEISD
jgi:hypothetical protein